MLWDRGEGPPSPWTTAWRRLARFFSVASMSRSSCVRQSPDMARAGTGNAPRLQVSARVQGPWQGAWWVFCDVQSAKTHSRLARGSQHACARWATPAEQSSCGLMTPSPACHSPLPCLDRCLLQKPLGHLASEALASQHVCASLPALLRAQGHRDEGIPRPARVCGVPPLRGCARRPPPAFGRGPVSF